MEEARGTRIIIHFDGARCIHSRNCVLGHPGVFVPNAKGSWLNPDAASSEQIAAIVASCPSGALTYERVDGGEDEAPPVVNTARVRENGPLAVHAQMEISGEAPRLRATLCRCGASKKKPYCDNSHLNIGFTATGEPVTRDSQALARRDGPLRVTPTTDGPLKVQGALEIVSGTGRTIFRCTETYLCRCGGSANKPYCDGTHKKIGFQSGD